jgi:hypothetical protein
MLRSLHGEAASANASLLFDLTMAQTQYTAFVVRTLTIKPPM